MKIHTGHILIGTMAVLGTGLIAASIMLTTSAKDVPTSSRDDSRDEERTQPAAETSKPDTTTRAPKTDRKIAGTEVQQVEFEDLLGAKRPKAGVYQTNAVLYGVIPKRQENGEMKLSSLKAIITNGKYTISMSTEEVPEKDKKYVADTCKPVSDPSKAACKGNVVVKVVTDQYGRPSHRLIRFEK